MRRKGMLGLVLAGAVAGSLVIACEPSPEPRLGADDVGLPRPSEADLLPEPTDTPKVAKVEPLVDLGRGLFVVDVRSGAATRLPRRITSVRGADNYDVSPDGSMILFDNARLAAPSDEPVERGLHQLYVANIDGSNVRQLTDDPIGASEASWSPDGTKVVYLGRRARLCCWRFPAELTVLDLETGTTTVLAHGPAFRFSDPYFSVDGSSIHFNHYNDLRPDLWTIPARGGRPESFLVDRGSANPSPDGTSLVYQQIETESDGHCGSDYGVLWISDADGGHPRPLAPRAADDGRSTGASAWSPDGTRIAYYENLVPYEPCDFNWKPGVYVKDMETSHRTLISFGYSIDWLNDHTLLIRSAGRGGQG